MADHPQNQNLHALYFGLPSVVGFGNSEDYLLSLGKALLATALFRCWHILVFFGVWSTMIALISNNVRSLAFQPTLLTVFGTVLGFVVSYRTTSSFERYNEGRKYWSQIVHGSRNMARAVWFHLPENPVETEADKAAGRTSAEIKARILIEKKTVINLVEAFAVSVKHYLRGEEGIFYEDLYHLVKYLPSFTLPDGPVDGMSRAIGVEEPQQSALRGPAVEHRRAPPQTQDNHGIDLNADLEKGKTSGVPPISSPSQSHSQHAPRDPFLLPAHMPPEFDIFSVFPLSLLVKPLLTEGEKEQRLKKEELQHAILLNQKSGHITQNVPLEISLYLTSYVATLASRKWTDVPTSNFLIATVTQLTDALTGLERIVTTPIPFSYSVHLWLVTAMYCLALPFQLWAPMKWLSIPATVIGSFVFFGFLVAGEEIENPFGYDKNDLNLDHFTKSIIRQELMDVTSRPPSNPSDWVFSPRNDRVMTAGAAGKVPNEDGHGSVGEVPKVVMPPSEWIAKGLDEMQTVLACGREHMPFAGDKQ